jgi:hypothetical protein
MFSNWLRNLKMYSSISSSSHWCSHSTLWCIWNDVMTNVGVDIKFLIVKQNLWMSYVWKQKHMSLWELKKRRLVGLVICQNKNRFTSSFLQLFLICFRINTINPKSWTSCDIQSYLNQTSRIFLFWSENIKSFWRFKKNSFRRSNFSFLLLQEEKNIAKIHAELHPQEDSKG